MRLINLEDCRFQELHDLETSCNGLPHMFVLEQFVNGVVGGDHKQLMLEVNSTSLDFTCAGVPVCPDLNMVKETNTVLVKVIEYDNGLPGVAVPPFVLSLEVEVTFLKETCSTRLTCSRRPYIPKSTDIWSFISFRLKGLKSRPRLMDVSCLHN